MRRDSKIEKSRFGNRSLALGRRLNPLGESIDHPTGHAVETLESKETRAQRKRR